MTTCPNCGRPITDEDVKCPNCHFDLQKYRETFFTDQHQKAVFEDEKTGKKLLVANYTGKNFIQQSKTLLLHEC